MDRVFHDLHYRSADLALRHTSHRTRSLVEHTALLAAVYAFCVVLVSHRTFVYRTTVGDAFGDSYGDGGGGVWGGKKGKARKTVPTGCLRSVPGFVEEGDGDEPERQPDVIHVMIGEDELGQSYSFSSSDRQRYVDATCSPSNENDGGKECSARPNLPESKRWGRRRRGRRRNRSSDAEKQEQTSSSQNVRFPDDSRILYSYSLTKGFLLLPPTTRSKYNITSRHVVVSPTDVRCFGEPFLQKLVFRMALEDTVAMNWLLGLNDGRGYLFKPRTNDLIDLGRYSSEYYFMLPRSGIGVANEPNDIGTESASEGGRRRGVNHRWASRRRFLVFKVGILLTSLFIFFVITNLVAFTLRETQDRMLAFTFQLRDHVRSGTPIGRLVFSHVIENLVFVPIMVGMVFFLVEFYGGDKFLAFTTLSVVWVCEVFSVISMRSIQGMQFFPRVFFLYFTLFHVYFFSCPFGFSYTSLGSTGLFLLHSMLFFINRFELPAVLNGTVTAPPSPGRRGGGRGGGHNGGNAAGNAGTITPLTYTAASAFGSEQQRGDDDAGSSQLPGNGNVGSAADSTNDETIPSIPSMSSLGRWYRNTSDDDDPSIMFFMNGEVALHRENHSSQSLQSTLSAAAAPTDADGAAPHPEGTTTPLETPQAVSPSSSLDTTSGSNEGRTSSQQEEEEESGRNGGSPLTPRLSNLGANSGSEISLPNCGGSATASTSALSCFDWNGQNSIGSGVYHLGQQPQQAQAARASIT